MLNSVPNTSALMTYYIEKLLLTNEFRLFVNMSLKNIMSFWFLSNLMNYSHFRWNLLVLEFWTLKASPGPWTFSYQPDMFRHHSKWNRQTQKKSSQFLLLRDFLWPRIKGGTIKNVISKMFSDTVTWSTFGFRHLRS